jgi:hypothetical protein
MFFSTALQKSAIVAWQNSNHTIDTCTMMLARSIVAKTAKSIRYNRYSSSSRNSISSRAGAADAASATSDSAGTTHTHNTCPYRIDISSYC